MKKKELQDDFLRKRAERQRKIRKRRLRITFVVFTVLLLCTAVILSLTVFFPIEVISISGNSLYSESQISKHSGVNIGDNLFTCSASKMQDLLKKKLPYIESVKLERNLPATLQISVTEAEEFACYFLDEKYFIVSESGWVLSDFETPPENLPIVYGAAVKCEVGTALEMTENANSELLNTILNASKVTGIKLDSINLVNRTEIRLRAEGRFEVNLGTANDLEDKIKHLASMIENIPKEQSGKINLSMWSKKNTQGTFAPTK